MKNKQAPQHFPVSGGSYRVIDNELVREEAPETKAAPVEPSHKKGEDANPRHRSAKG